MGLSSSKKAPQPPLPTLAIYLDQPNKKTYRPNDIVKGYIALRPAIHIEPHALHVTFFGHSLIWRRVDISSSENPSKYHHWRDNAPLFEVTEDVLLPLLSGAKGESSKSKSKSKATTASLEPRQTYTFPFEFRFPDGTENARQGQYKNETDQKFTVGPHALPPSFLYTNVRASSAGYGTEPDFAKTQYGVRATLICPGTGIVQGKKAPLKDLSTKRTLAFLPLPTASPRPLSLVRYARTFTLQSSTLNGTLSPDKLTFRQSLTDRFSSSTPKLDFVAALEIPDYLCSGQEFQFRATFTVANRTANVVYIPPVTLRVKKLDLLDFTFYRAPRDCEASDCLDGHHLQNKYEFWPPPDQLYVAAKEEHEEYHEGEMRINSIPEVATVELERVPAYTVVEPVGREKAKAPAEMEQAKSCEAWFTARVPSVVLPNFRSFAITRAYRVRVKLGVEIGGKKFDMQAESFVKEMGSCVG